MKIKTRLLLILLSVIITGSIFTFGFLRFAARDLLRTYVFSGDREKARLYASLLGEYYLEKKSWRDVQDFLSDIPRLAFNELDRRIHGEHSGYRFFSPEDLQSLITERIVLADEEGIIVADTTKTLLGTRHPLRHLAGGTPVMADFRKVGTVLVGSMIDSSLTDSAEAFLDAMTRTFTAATLLSGLIAFLLGLVVTLGITKTLVDLSRGAKRIGSGDLQVRIPVRGKDETAELAESFNRMAEELQKLEEAKRRIIADAAHELRTPLTLIRGTIEGMMDGVLPLDMPTLKSAHEDTLRLSRLIDTLRELEIIESGKLKLNLEDIDPADLARRAAAPFVKASAEKDITLTVCAAGPVLPAVRGDYIRLGQVLYNLLANALRHTPKGGRIHITVRTDKKRETVTLTVEDSGPGIPEGEHEKIFERFYRMDRSRSSEEGGRGLGLSIAREIVKAHSGSITAEASEEFGGASFRVELPTDRE
jgi:signal transduction histidine kinase